MINAALAAQQVIMGLLTVGHMVGGNKYLAAICLLSCALVAFVREARRQ
jgi:hypothetical protein